MIGFYSIRKLIESHKISDNLRDRPVPLQGYPWSGKHVTYMNWDKIDRNYDLESPEPLHESVAWISNKLVHSYVFMAKCSEGGRLESILFNSDHTRRNFLYEIEIDQLIALFEEIGVNNPASSSAFYNRKTGDFDVIVGPTMEIPEAGL